MEDIGHEFNGTMMLEDCWSVPGGRCWVKVDTLKSEKGSRYDVQHISRGCTVETAEEEEATDYCAISTNAANVITQKNCLSHCDKWASLVEFVKNFTFQQLLQEWRFKWACFRSAADHEHVTPVADYVKVSDKLQIGLVPKVNFACGWWTSLFANTKKKTGHKVNV